MLTETCGTCRQCKSSVPQNFGVCEKCKAVAPLRHAIRDGKVFVTKDCPTCGTTEALVSSDAATWQRKRDICNYNPALPTHACQLTCDSCSHLHHPRMVFLNVTNRCNMNCPICIANIPGMGFEFHPPLAYFERVLDGLTRFNPKPTVHLFGGEPTMRDDLFDIIRIARAKGIHVGIVTNGLKLADEAYCKKVCESGARVLLAFDGCDRSIYERLRKNPGAYEKKLQALEHLKKFSRRKHTIMCCVARNINDKHMRGLIDFCHENRAFISYLHLIPLTENWKEGEFETGVTTTIEDVEQIIDDAFPGETVEYLPAHLPHRLKKAMSFFGSPRLTFGGVHPNCESATVFLSDGTRYRPIGSYLKRPLAEAVHETIRRAQAIDPKLDRLDPTRAFGRWRGRLLVLRTFGGLWLRTFDLKKITRGNPWWAITRAAFAFLHGVKLRDIVARYTTVEAVLGSLILPFEEHHSVEAERLKFCTAGFAFEDPGTREVKTIPVCSWPLFRDGIERKIVDKYTADVHAAGGI